MSRSVLSEIQLRKYTLLGKLGEGTFASVHEILNNQTNEHYAVKQIYVQKPYLEDVKVEVKRLEDIDSDNIIKIIESDYDEEQFFFNIVMELCKGSLRKQMEDRTVFDQEKLLTFIIQITSAFLELQNCKMMHLDLKPQNILYANDEGTYYKICDFGCSQISNISRLSGYENSIFGTFNYLAPEIFLNYQGKKTRTSADIWSLGIILYQMIFWRYPFPKKDDKYNIDRQLATNYFYGKAYQINYDAIEGSPFKIIQIIKLMLVSDPTQRINWIQLKQYLMKNFKVQEHEFMNINPLIINFIPITELYLKVSAAISKNCGGNAHLFWQSNTKFMHQLKEDLIYYFYIICDGFHKIYEAKYKLVAAVHQQKVNGLLEQLVKERQRCSDKVKEFQDKELAYRQTRLYDKIKVCVGKIGAFKGSMDSSLIFVQTFCLQLSELIRNDKGIFADLKSFERSFKVKYTN